MAAVKPGKIGMRLTWIVGVTFVAVVLVGFAGYALQVRQQALVEARAETATLSDVIAHHAERTFYGINQLFQGLHDAFLLTPEVDAVAHDPGLRSILRSHQAQSPYLMDLLVVSPEGVIRHWTGPGEPPDVTDRDYVRRHLMDDVAGELFIGEPQLSRVHKDRWFFGASRAFRDDSGKIKRIMVAIIDVDFFKSAYESWELPPLATVLMASPESRIYSRVPDHNKMVGRQVAELFPFQQGSEARRLFRGVSPLDSRPRVVAFRRLTDYPDLAVVVSLDEQAVLRQWARDLIWISIFLCVFMLAVVGTLWVLGYQFKRYERARAELALLAVTDPLTQTFNRRHFVETADAEIKRHRRYERPMAILMIDLDHFKRINDTFGHRSGDLVLTAFAELTRSQLRSEDCLARLGGEEFGVLLPETSAEQAINVAEKVRRSVADHDFSVDGRNLSVTVSIGSVALRADDTWETFYKRADDALYQAKQAGRNRTISG